MNKEFNQVETKNNAQRNSIIDQLLVVNRSAGYLRMVLLILLLFIIWSLTAQFTKPEPAINGIFFSDSQNFTTGIIRDLIRSYFSPYVLIFTFFPLTMFFLIRIILSDFILVLFPTINKKSIANYFNACAFSIPQRFFEIQSKIQNTNRALLQELKYFGGPAAILMDSDQIPIISSANDGSSVFLLGDIVSEKKKFILNHREKIETVTSTNRAVFHLNQIGIHGIPNKTIQIEKIDVEINLLQKKALTQQKSTFQLSQSDVTFLCGLQSKNKEDILSFLVDTIRSFFRNEYLPNAPNLVADLSNEFNNIHNPRSNSNFIKFNKIRYLSIKQTFRKHRHTLYPYLIAKTQPVDLPSGIKIEERLVNCINEQLRSFFHTTNIYISRIDISNIKINGKSQKIN